MKLAQRRAGDVAAKRRFASEAPCYPHRPRRKKNQTRIRTGIGTPKSHSKLPVSMFFSLVLLLQPRGAKIRSWERSSHQAIACPVNFSRKLLMSRPHRVALPWYAAEHYEALRQSLSDGGKLPVQYEAWRASTEQVEREVQCSGVEVVRVPIEPDTFAAWCKDAGLPPDGTARARYAAEALER